MFKFNFNSSSDTETRSTSAEPQENLLEKKYLWHPSQEIFPNLKEDLDNNFKTDCINIASKECVHIKSSNILNKIKYSQTNSTDSILFADCNNSDLIPGLYEGGLKVWECTHDIGQYLNLIDVEGKSVLDLGCGTGLLGILSLGLGAESVIFQDYNADVLNHATIPNVRLNTDESSISRCRFFSGDWESFAGIADFTCDVILSSETIYNPDNYSKLHNAIHKLLKPGGIVLIGAKSYYFGVGGSTRQFEHMILENKVFTVETVWKSSEGVMREILKLTHKTNESALK